MPTLETGWKCQGCDYTVVDEPEKDSLYECPECGSKYARSQEGTHRCPNCGKFGSKISDHACPECFEDEMVEQDVWQCDYCEEAFDFEEDAKEHELNAHLDNEGKGDRSDKHDHSDPEYYP